MSRGEPLSRKEIVPVSPGVLGHYNYRYLLEGQEVTHTFKTETPAFKVGEVIQARGGSRFWVPVEVLSLKLMQPGVWEVQLKTAERLQRWEITKAEGFVEDFDLQKQVTFQSEEQDPPVKRFEEVILIFTNRGGKTEERPAYADVILKPNNQSPSVLFRPGSPPPEQPQ